MIFFSKLTEPLSQSYTKLLFEFLAIIIHYENNSIWVGLVGIKIIYCIRIIVFKNKIDGVLLKFTNFLNFEII